MRRAWAVVLLAIFAASSSALAIIVTTGTEQATLFTQLGCPVPARVFPLAPVRSSHIRGTVLYREYAKVKRPTRRGAHR